jgi:hypothetical protein
MFHFREAEEYSGRECLVAVRIKKPVIYRLRATPAPETRQFGGGHYFDAPLAILQIATSMTK